MAKARATCTCVTCGKTFDVTTVKANSKEARRFEEWAEVNITECNDCKDKRIAAERDAENAKAAENAAEQGWPELTGTEKQVAWANTIRMNEITQIKKLYKRGEMDEAIDFILGEKTTASWWIDNQNAVSSLVRDYGRNPEKLAAAKAVKEAAAEAANDIAIIAEPENRSHDGIVDIKASEQCVRAAYRKDDDFRELVKGLGYRWNGNYNAWQMKISEKTGTAAERAAELGNKLLNAGFAIRIQDPETLQNAIDGNYEPMTSRWISTSENAFFITWAKDDDFYDRARMLPGAKYSRPGIRVPNREYEAVLDFAGTYDFKLTQTAQELVQQMQSASRVVTPASAKVAEYNERPVADILNSSRDILEDLMDD